MANGPLHRALCQHGRAVSGDTDAVIDAAREALGEIHTHFLRDF